ncbi:unnamed protein product [Arabis nemorensis]|uniref:Malectin-like domain-containing protein n=1 Tax=Arabis nemorensis TaxID=586526 RepID=A0A565AWJ3_9BRAS|nr:unnamed protein product [Arabis nemorensis]
MAQASFISLLLSFSIIILSNAADINIDCGSSSSQVDAENRTWIGDTDFVTTGLTSSFKPMVKTADSLTTLRYFPTGETNCYSNIPVDKGGKVLVRTRFNYGNYDGEDKAPKFDVVYDGKHRDSVVTTTFISGTRSEAIFIPENGNTSVCFFRTFLNENPFVSTIEVRRLDDSMYTDLGPKEGFILQQRNAYGRVQDLVRSPFDPYDRIWAPTPLSTVTLTSAATSINTTGADNRPPEIVLRTAWSRKDMAFYDIKLPFSGVTFYIVLYFSEPLSLGSEQKRSFFVNYDNKQVGASQIVPPFGAVTQASLRAVGTSSLPYLTFKATPDSNLNPLINALELYVISNSAGNGTGSTTTGSGGSPSTGGGGSPTTGGGGGSPSTGGGSGSPKPGGGTPSSSGKSEGEKGSNLGLPLGLSIPSSFIVLGVGGWYGYKFFNKAKRNPESERPLTTSTTVHHHYGTEHNIIADKIGKAIQTTKK